jgi:hypothetical protein
MSAATQKAHDAIAWTPPYPYADVLAACVEQAMQGKGQERHNAAGAPFIQQPWVKLAKSHSPGFLTGQAEKKWIEANSSAIARDDERFIREVVGAINYSLMALIMLADRELSQGRVSPQRAAMSAAAWLAGVWPNQADYEAFQRQKKWDGPAFIDHDRTLLIVLTRFQIFVMAKAVHERMAKMDPPMVVPPLRFPPVLNERVA